MEMEINAKLEKSLSLVGQIVSWVVFAACAYYIIVFKRSGMAPDQPSFEPARTAEASIVEHKPLQLARAQRRNYAEFVKQERLLSARASF